jgi:hypothetical protein
MNWTRGELALAAGFVVCMFAIGGLLNVGA